MRKVKVVVWEDEKVEKVNGSRADTKIFYKILTKLLYIQVYMRANTQ